MRYLLSGRRSSGGYSLLEMLLSMVVIASLLLIVSPMLSTLRSLMTNEKYRYQDEIGIYQLQIALACGRITEVDYDHIVYMTAENECYLELNHDNLISTPGWLCYLYKVDDASFYLEDDVVLLEYERDNEYFLYPIAYYKKSKEE